MQHLLNLATRFGRSGPLLLATGVVSLWLWATPGAWAQTTGTRAATVAPPPSIRLDITTHLGDGQAFREGDALSFYVSTDRDAYLLILYRDAGGRITQLLPNRLSGNSYYRAGEYISVPGRDAPFEFNISAPFGEEQVWAFSASEAFPVLPGSDLDNGLRSVEAGLDAVRLQLKQHSDLRGAAFGEARLGLTTRAAR